MSVSSSIMRRVLVLSILLVTNAYSQQLIGGSLFGNEAFDSNICGKTTAAANVTGLYSYNPKVGQLNQTGEPDNDSHLTLPIEWLATVSETSGTNNASVQFGLWFSSSGANYSYDLGLGYDVCAYVMVIENKNWLARAQEDDGDCTTAFDQSCVSDIEQKAQQYAVEMIFEPGTTTPRSNLTANSVNSICTNIAQALSDNFPSSCNEFMNLTTPVAFDGGALTSSNDSAIYQECTITNPATNGTFHHIAGLNKYTGNVPSTVTEYYNEYNYLTVPMLTVFMPLAHSGYDYSIQRAASNLQCVRPTSFALNAKHPPPFPSPTPYSSGGLSGGDIAGIVIGVIAGVALLAAGVFLFLWRKNRRVKKLETFEPAEKGVPPPYSPDAKVQMSQLDTSQEYKPAVEAPDTAVTELSPETSISKEGVSDRPAELEGEEDAAVEKEAPQIPVELPTNPPRELR